MFVFDILIYVFFAWIMCSLAKRANFYGEGTLGAKYYIWYFMLFFAVICGIRYNVGVDCMSYIKQFKTGYIAASRTEETLWWCFVKAIHNMDIHYTVGMGLVAFLQIFFIVKALRGCQYILSAMPLVLFGSIYFWDMTNGMRQVIVACIFLYVSRFITDRKPIPYFLLLFLASLVHHSALIIFPLYIIAYIPASYLDVTKYRKVCICLLFACLFLGMTHIFQGMVSYLEGMTKIFGYDDYTDRVSLIVGGNYTSETRAFGPMQLSYFLVALAITWFGPLLNERYGEENRFFHLWYFFANIYGCLYFLVCNTSHLFIRIVQYFEFFQMIIVSMLLYLFYEQKIKYKWHLFLLIIVMWVSTCWNITKNSGVSGESVSYKVFLFNDI